jgi:hypothetical protein
MWSEKAAICFAITRFHPCKIGHQDVTFYEVIYTTSLFWAAVLQVMFLLCINETSSDTEFCLLKKLAPIYPEQMKTAKKVQSLNTSGKS